MWAETGVEEEARLIKVVESESESAPKAHHSPDANAPSRPQNFLAELLDRVACWVRACRDVAALMARELGWSSEQVQREIEHYCKRIAAERDSQRMPDDETADSARMGAPEIVPVR